MARYTLKRFRRDRPGKAWGPLDKVMLEFEATDPVGAIQIARKECMAVKWDTHFVSLSRDDGEFAAFFSSLPQVFENPYKMPVRYSAKNA